MNDLINKIKEVCRCSGTSNLNCPCQPLRQQLMDLNFNMNNLTNWEEKKGEFIRDLTQVTPRSKSEVRARLDTLLEQAKLEGRREAIIAEDQRYLETNIVGLLAEMKEDLQQWGDLHGELCPCNMEDPDECDCEEMKQIASFAEEWMGKVNHWWVKHAEAHRKHCTSEGNKMLTKIMGKKNRSRTSLDQLGDK